MFSGSSLARICELCRGPNKAIPFAHYFRSVAAGARLPEKAAQAIVTIHSDIEAGPARPRILLPEHAGVGTRAAGQL